MKQGQATRLRRLEQQARPAHGGFELWVGTGEDELLGPNGEIITVEAFEWRYRDAQMVSLDDGSMASGMRH